MNSAAQKSLSPSKFDSHLEQYSTQVSHVFGLTNSFFAAYFQVFFIVWKVTAKLSWIKICNLKSFI